MEASNEDSSFGLSPSPRPMRYSILRRSSNAELVQAGVVAVDGYFDRLIVTYDENGQGTIAYPCEDDDAAK